MADRPNSRSDEAFQKLLLQLSAAAAEGTAPAILIRLFCHASRVFFQIQGTYIFQLTHDGELQATEADGLFADRFRGFRPKTNEKVVMEAIRRRKTVYSNYLDPDRQTLIPELRGRAIMAVPLVVANEARGAVVFLHTEVSNFFNDDLATKATIMTGQLGSLLEANRAQQTVAHPENNSAEALAEAARSLQTAPDTTSVVQTMAERLRVALHTRVVSIFISQGGGFTLRSVAAETANMADLVRARYDRKGLQFAGEVAARAIAAAEPVTVSVDAASHSLGDLVPAGVMIAAPFRTASTQGVALIYPRSDGSFSKEEKSLAAAIAGVGSVALTNSELFATAKAQTHEVHELLAIASQLNSIRDLDQFMQEFCLHASDFLGYSRACIGLLEPDGVFHVRWKAEQGEAGRIDLALGSGVVSQSLKNREAFWTDDLMNVPNANTERIASLNVKQLLAVPLLDTQGQVVGMFGVLDRHDHAGVSQEDIRRARALSSQASVALEVARNLNSSQQNRARSEALMSLALEVSSLRSIHDFTQAFASRAAELTNAPAYGLALRQEHGWETAVLHSSEAIEDPENPLVRRFASAVGEATLKHHDLLVAASAPDLIGPALAASLGWANCALLRLSTQSGELAAVLCLANLPDDLSIDDQNFLQAMARHASVALENSRLFTRMDHANRHWTEIFDAISDFIVAHDESGRVLRINRSLADFIGVSPQSLIGVNMSALLALGNTPALTHCPFCRTSGNATDEYIHPVLDRTYLVSTSRVPGDNSEGMQTIHVLKDITDRREAEQRYRELFGNIQEGLFFSTTDGRFIEVNDALVRMLGYSTREEVLEADIRHQIYFSDDAYDQFAQQMRLHGVVRNREEILQRKDGAPVYVLINAFAARDAQDRVLQYRGLMLDISGLKTYQAELQRERDFSSKILNNTQSLILVVDAAGNITYANRRWSDLGYQKEQLLGLPMVDLVTSTRQAAFVDAFHVTLQGQQVDNLDLPVLRGDERPGQFSVNLSPMRDEQGHVNNVVAVMTDVTDSATLQAKLIHAEKMAAVGQLVSGVAHEVNNPLTAILGFADLLMESRDLPESARKDMRVILQEAQRTKQIVQNLLSFARQMPQQRRPVQLNPILRRTVQLRAYDFHSHGVEVNEELDQALPEVIGDSQQLQQVFLNIMNNAYDAVHEINRPPRIDIVTTNHGGYVEIWFRDNGHGITNPEKIFDPFFTTKEVGKGTGLGLSICYGIVREHGGEILCHNNENDEGATFIVRLPAVSEAASVGAAAGVNNP
jgi:two-component system NtrC family sensor kinase